MTQLGGGYWLMSLFVVQGTTGYNAGEWPVTSMVFRAGGRGFVFGQAEMSWYEVKEFCSDRSAKMAKVDSPDIYSALVKAYDGYRWRGNSNVVKHCIIIGANDLSEERQWTWEDGELVTFSDWRAENWFERKIFASLWDCGRICIEQSGRRYWAKVPCLSGGWYACQFDLPMPLSTTPPLKEFKVDTVKYTVISHVGRFAEHSLTLRALWTAHVFTASQCARLCVNSQCKTMTFCRADRRCNGYAKLPRSQDTVPAPGCGVWEVRHIYQ